MNDARMTARPALWPERRRLVLACAAGGIALLLCGDTRAAIITWTGATSTDYATATNWSTGTVPANSDFADTARFADTSPANRTPNLAAGRSVGGLAFDGSTGWTFSGSQVVLRTVQSSGAGINTVSAALKTAPYDVTWTVGTGNTLILTSVYQDSSGKSLHLLGGGTLEIASRIDGWASSNKLYVENGLLKVDAATAYRLSGNKVYLTSDTSAVQLKTTVASATAMIGTSVIDSTGKGLTVTDIGGGYVAISVPEPATATLAGAASLMTLSVRPRGRRTRA